MINKTDINPNLKNYELACADFTWASCKDEIDFFPGDRVNAAFNAIDRHLDKGLANKIALYAVAEDESIEKFTFAQIAELSNRLANGLHSLGVKRAIEYLSFCHAL